MPPPAAAAGPTPRQPQSEIIVIDDSPQLPTAQPRLQPTTNQSEDIMEDADDNPAATQPGRRQKRQLLDSSSDSDQGAGPSKEARTASVDNMEEEFGALGADHSDNGHSGYDQGIENIDPAETYGACDTDIIPDSFAEVGGMPEVYEDYGNEPMFEDEIEEPINFYEDNAPMVEDDQATDMGGMDHADHAPEDVDAGDINQDGREDLHDEEKMPASPDGMVDTEPPIADGIGSSVGHLQAVQALFTPPHTTLSLMTQHLPHFPACDFPMSLRINGKLAKVLSKLLFKDAQHRPLPEYAISAELEDATKSCVAVVGHDILLEATGKYVAAV